MLVPPAEVVVGGGGPPVSVESQPTLAHPSTQQANRNRGALPIIRGSL
jgi:hypothetical protein